MPAATPIPADALAPRAPPPPPEGRRFEGADLLLTAPVFFLYHLGVVFLSVRNGCDPVTDLLLSVLDRSLSAYLGLTLGLGLLLALGVRLFRLGGTLNGRRVALRLGEATLYAVVMAVAARAVAAPLLGPREKLGPFTAVVSSMGAGFYEEVAFRVILFGLGAYLIGRWTQGVRRVLLEVGWALVAAFGFSAVHYVGSLGDTFALGSFVFRVVCGLVLTAIYRFRGFAAAVWTHAIYDVGVMV